MRVKSIVDFAKFEIKKYAKQILELVDMIDLEDKKKNNMTIAHLIAECGFFIIKRAIEIETADMIKSKCEEVRGDE